VTQQFVFRNLQLLDPRFDDLRGGYEVLVEGDKIREALVATDLPGEQTIMPWKRVKFDAMGQNNDADPVLLQYTGGKFVTIFPSQAAVAEAIWPMK